MGKKKSHQEQIEKLLRRARESANKGDHEQSLQYQRQAADYGCAETQARVALALCSEMLPGPTNCALAFKYASKSAAQNHPYGLYTLGRCYQDGIGVPADDSKSWDCHKKAADLGHAEAMHFVAEKYIGGIADGEVDLVEGRKWMKRAAENGGFQAAGVLARMYAEGIGGKQSREKAHFWMKKARESNSKLGLPGDDSFLDKTRRVLGDNYAEDAKVVFQKCSREACDQREVEGQRFNKCSRCKKAVYCSKECQVSDWKAHKAVCGPARANVS